MVVRWIHKGWKLFWEIVLSVAVIVIVLAGTTVGLLQLGATKGIIAEKVVNNFNQSHKGHLKIGALKGFLPFKVELQDVILTSSKSASADTLASVKDAKVKVDLWALFRDKLNIQALRLDQPSVQLKDNGSGGYTLANALQKRKPSAIKKSTGGPPIPNLEITAPKITIKDGSFYIQRFHHLSDNIKLPEPLRIHRVNTKMFVQSTKAHRFLNINNFTAHVQNVKAGNIALSGQVYNNNQVLEFNGFRLSAGRSQIRLNGKVKGINLYQGGLQKQLASSTFDLSVQSNRLQLTEFSDVLPRLPEIQKPLNFSVHISGEENALQLQKFAMSVGASHLNVNGNVDNLFRKNKLAYNLNIDTLAIPEQNMKMLAKAVRDSQYAALKKLNVKGKASGTVDSVSVNLQGSSGLGSFDLQAQGQLAAPYRYKGLLSARNLDVGPFTSTRIDTTNLNVLAQVSGQNTSLKTGTLNLKASAWNSFVNKVKVDSLHINTSLQQGLMYVDYVYRNNRQLISGNGNANFNAKYPPITLRGKTRNLNVPAFLAKTAVDSTRLNANYNINIKGTSLDQVYGKVQLNVLKSIIDGQPVQAQHFDVQLSSPDMASRTLKINSSPFDLTVRGDLKPTNISHQMTYWSNYFKERMDKEIRLDSTAYVPQKRAPQVNPLHLKGQFKAKNLKLIKRYLPGFPQVSSNLTADFNLQADSTNLQFSSNIQSDTISVNNIDITDAVSQIRGRFNHNKTLKKSGNLTVKNTAGSIKSHLVKMDTVTMQLNYRHNSLYYAQQVKRFSKKAHFDLKMHSTLSRQNIKVTIDKFFLGNNKYAWQTKETPQFTYNRNKKVIFHNFRFRNGNGYFALEGILSPYQSDSLKYVIHQVNLARISNLLRGRINFSGRLNGKLQTRSLTRQPSIEGNLFVDGLKLENRLVGDVRLTSRFNKKADHYDTRLKILTDSSKYKQYLKSNNGIGQNILLKGYFKPAGLSGNQHTALHFNANFKEMDMWVFHLLLPNIFNQVNGRAYGTGAVSGNLQNLQFHADLKLDSVKVQPALFKTNYYLKGPISISSKKGVQIGHVKVNDDQGGTGMITGNVDLNNFKPVKFIHLRMNLNDLKFLNSGYSPGTPFFGDMAASGSFRLDGPTTHLKLRSSQAIRVSRNSTFGIPLLTETQFNTTNSFIQFVDSLSAIQTKRNKSNGKQLAKSNGNGENRRTAMQNLSFSERFDLDLQFVATNPINVRLIFDPVTHEGVTANGTGRLRLTMHDGNMQLFGHFSVEGGTYQFVSGEIISRKFDINPGGSIVWEGPPANARLNIQAVYHARPTVSSLNNPVNQPGKGNIPQRVPIDLVVQLSGTMQQLQKDIHLKIPNTFNIASNTELEYAINQINSNEQQRFKQAASILLTGNFLATGTSASQTNQLTSTLTRSSTFINPILSNQVISPLVSRQINSLLKSNSTHFNFDFRLNQYNQIDLGIGLSLLNDKLIFHREGYLTGGSVDTKVIQRIGNLGATYRLNRNLSLTAFHREDLTLSTLTPTAQTSEIIPTVNGAGVQAQVQFNTWQELAHKVKNFFRKLVGKKPIDFKNRARKTIKMTDNTTKKKN
ncbi:MAG TPA: hypothetical protein VE868_03980 [Balneolaceae bacterium]|nr:hypothetical protein [Balneolaceae bacterium]